MKTKKEKPKKEQFHPFTFFTVDVNWEDYGGVWVRPIGRRAFHFIEWIPNGESDKHPGYVQLAEVDLQAIPATELSGPLRFYGWAFDDDGLVDSHSGDVVVGWDKPAEMDLHIAGACFAYGNKAVLFDEETRAKVGKIKEAVRESNMLVRDAAKHAAALSKPSNKIGSTALELMRGDIGSALKRAETPEAALMLGIYEKPGMMTLGAGPASSVLNPPERKLSVYEKRWLAAHP